MMPGSYTGFNGEGGWEARKIWLGRPRHAPPKIITFSWLPFR